MLFDEKSLKKEKAKARELRQSQWWKRKLSKGECFYCRKIISPCDLTMDHVVPLSRGGKSSRGNLVTACKDCNNKKRNLLPFEWAEYLDMINKKI